MVATIPSEFDIIESSYFGENSVVESVKIPENVEIVKVGNENLVK